MCCQLTDTKTRVSQVYRKGAGPGVTCQVVRGHVSWISMWPHLFHGVEAHESQSHVGKAPQPAACPESRVRGVKSHPGCPG